MGKFYNHDEILQPLMEIVMEKSYRDIGKGAQKHRGDIDNKNLWWSLCTEGYNTMMTYRVYGL